MASIIRKTNNKTIMWKNYINGILGIVLVAIAFLDLSGTTLTWTLGITGALIAILGFWGGTETSEVATTRHA